MVQFHLWNGLNANIRLEHFRLLNQTPNQRRESTDQKTTTTAYSLMLQRDTRAVP